MQILHQYRDVTSLSLVPVLNFQVFWLTAQSDEITGTISKFNSFLMFSTLTSHIRSASE